jgi:mannan endo-1,4-beta-mannosidase
MKRRVWAAIAAICWAFVGMAAKEAPAAKFVMAKGGQFLLDGKPYYFVGTNFWSGAILGSTTKAGNRVRLLKELDQMKAIGINNVRVLVGAEGGEDSAYRVAPTLQVQPGKYNEDLLTGLDYLLAEMGKRQMVAVLFLTNSWDWSGGYGRYLEWNGYGKMPAIPSPDFDWPKYQEYMGQFHTCEPCRQMYFDQIRKIVGRTNTVTKRKYTEDPTIMTWELGNEPRAFGKSRIPAFEKTLSSASAFIKSLDKNHLVTTGSEGAMGSEDSIELFEKVHADPNIDYLTIHIWPKNWTWLDVKDIPGSVDGAIAKTDAYVASHLEVANRLKKPLVLEEFGLPRDNHGYLPSEPTVARDKYFENLLKKVAESGKKNDVLAGLNFWAYGGFGRPAQVWFKAGDDFLGDPPCEEQGLNTVFDTDTTIRLVKQFSAELNRK